MNYICLHKHIWNSAAEQGSALTGRSTMSVSRRGFLKFGLGAALAGAVSGLGFDLRPAFAAAK